MKTAVEFIESEVKMSDGVLTKGHLLLIIEQAKEMEKENAINFALQNVFGKTDVGVNLKNDYIKKYNETFKSE